MSRARIAVVAITLACAGVSFAATTKIRAFHAAGAGTCANPDADGMSIIKLCTDPNLGYGSNVHLHMQDLACNETYGVAIYSTCSVEADYVNVLAFTTNASGNGTFETFLPTHDLGAHPKIQVFLWDCNPDLETFLVITPAELRAEGTVN